MRSLNYRKLFLITWFVITIATTSLCRNVAEADAMLAIANQNTPKRSHRQSKEMKFDAVDDTPAADEPLAIQDDVADDNDDDDSPWTRLLENWVVNNPTETPADRNSRQMHNAMMMGRFGQQPPPMSSSNNGGGFYIKRRMGEAAPRNDRQQPPNGFRPNNRPLPPALNFEQIRQTSADISETDLYLLSAIEKLAHRVDYLEKRLQTTDKLILHLLNDIRKENPPPNIEEPILKPNRPTTPVSWNTASLSSTATTVPQTSAASVTTTIDTSTSPSPSILLQTTAALKPKPKPTKPATTTTKPVAVAANTLCPRDFTAIATVCYHFNSNEHSDWKSANGRCRQLGGNLAEFTNSREFKAVGEYLAANGTRSATSSYWLGGLNPGLLWIWSSSAKPVNSAANFAAFGAQYGSIRNSTTVIPPKAATAGVEQNPQKERNVFDIQGNGRCLSLQYNRTLRGFEYMGEDCSRPHGYVCEMHNRRVENEISRVFRALRLE